MTVIPIKPVKLNPGDRVAVLTPSWGGPSVFPHIYDKGLETLERWGLRIVEYPTTRAPARELYIHPEARARDLMDAFSDPGIKAIIASIGGDDSVRLLPHLDPNIIQANPKILLGYSDVTTLLVYCHLQGLVTFHGPTVMAGLGQLAHFPVALEHTRRFLFEPQSSYNYAPYSAFVEGYPDWAVPENAGKVNAIQENTTGWQWIQGEGVVTGPLFGGCIEVLEFLKGTMHWPQPDFWDGKVLFFETSEEVPTPDQVKYMVRNYATQGILDRVAGILVGRPRGYSLAQKLQLEQNLREVLAIECARPDLPLVMNIDFGHTDPQFVLPLGVELEVNCTRWTISLHESPVVE